jgi:hypothetical protein
MHPLEYTIDVYVRKTCHTHENERRESLNAETTPSLRVREDWRVHTVKVNTCYQNVQIIQ